MLNLLEKFFSFFIFESSESLDQVRNIGSVTSWRGKPEFSCNVNENLTSNYFKWNFQISLKNYSQFLTVVFAQWFTKIKKYLLLKFFRISQISNVRQTEWFISHVCATSLKWEWCQNRKLSKATVALSMASAPRKLNSNHCTGSIQ